MKKVVSILVSIVKALNDPPSQSGVSFDFGFFDYLVDINDKVEVTIDDAKKFLSNAVLVAEDRESGELSLCGWLVAFVYHKTFKPTTIQVGEIGGINTEMGPIQSMKTVSGDLEVIFKTKTNMRTRVSSGLGIIQEGCGIRLATAWGIYR